MQSFVSVVPRASRLPRVTKAVMQITPLAARKIQELTSEHGAAAVKVGVAKRGCNGLTYTLDFAEEKGQLDEVVKEHGATVFIDNRALMTILGSEMDWVDAKLRSEFVFSNPNVKGTCGCNESFHV